MAPTLLTLPPEIRNRIFHYVTGESCTPHIGCHDKDLSQHLNAHLKYCLICKKITAEIGKFVQQQPKIKVCGFLCLRERLRYYRNACDGTPGSLSLLLPSYLFNNVKLPTADLLRDWLYENLRMGAETFTSAQLGDESGAYMGLVVDFEGSTGVQVRSLQQQELTLV
jgi:hypothetical protein